MYDGTKCVSLLFIIAGDTDEDYRVSQRKSDIGPNSKTFKFAWNSIYECKNCNLLREILLIITSVYLVKNIAFKVIHITIFT